MVAPLSLGRREPVRRALQSLPHARSVADDAGHVARDHRSRLLGRDLFDEAHNGTE